MAHLVRSILSASLLTVAAAAQSALHPGDVAVITDAGLWLIQPPLTIEQFLLPASAFGGLSDPAVDWRPGTDELMVCNGDKLFRVLVSGFPATATVTDITPSGVAGGLLLDVEFHAYEGWLAVLDASQNEVLRYSPPFTANMAPDLVIPVAATPSRCMAVNSREWPASVFVGYGSSIKEHTFEGATEVVVPVGIVSIDQSRQAGPVTIASRNVADSIVMLIGSDSLVVEINMTASLCKPVVIEPGDVEYDTTVERAVIFAAGGVNPACFAGITGPNHVVTLPLGQAPGILPGVLTGGISTIGGGHADLTMVWEDQAFASVYGSATGTVTARLEALQDPYPGNGGFAVEVSKAGANLPVLLLVGLTPANLVLGGGQAVLVSTPMLLYGGITLPSGKLTVTAPMPANMPLGVEVRMQAVTFGTPLRASNGVVLHIAAP